MKQSQFGILSLTILPILILKLPSHLPYFLHIVDFVSIRLTPDFPMFSARFTDDKWERDEKGNYREKPSSLPKEKHDEVMFFSMQNFSQLHR